MQPLNAAAAESTVPTGHGASALQSPRAPYPCWLKLRAQSAQLAPPSTWSIVSRVGVIGVAFVSTATHDLASLGHRSFQGQYQCTHTYLKPVLSWLDVLPALLAALYGMILHAVSQPASQLLHYQALAPKSSLYSQSRETARAEGCYTACTPWHPGNRLILHSSAMGAACAVVVHRSCRMQYCTHAHSVACGWSGTWRPAPSSSDGTVAGDEPATSALCRLAGRVYMGGNSGTQIINIPRHIHNRQVHIATQLPPVLISNCLMAFRVAMLRPLGLLMLGVLCSMMTTGEGQSNSCASRQLGSTTAQAQH